MPATASHRCLRWKSSPAHRGVPRQRRPRQQLTLRQRRPLRQQRLRIHPQLRQLELLAFRRGLLRHRDRGRRRRLVRRSDFEACLALVRLLPDEGGSSLWRGPERFRGCALSGERTRPEIFARKCFGSAMRRRIAFNRAANPESGARTRTHFEGPAATGHKGKP